jgi:hypothetical protein
MSYRLTSIKLISSVIQRLKLNNNNECYVEQISISTARNFLTTNINFGTEKETDENHGSKKFNGENVKKKLIANK